MKKALLGLFAISLLVTGCQKKEDVKEKKSKDESINIEYVKPVADEEDENTFEFKFSLPEDYSKMLIKERVYKGNQLVTDEVISEEKLEKKTDTFLVSWSVEDNEITGFVDFPTSSSSMGSVGTTHTYPSMISYDVNETKVTEPKMDLLAARWKTSEESTTLESASMVFDQAFNIEKDMTEDESIVIWSCEFTQ